MSVDNPSSVDVNVLDNPIIVNIGTSDRIVAIVGYGPTTFTITDEAVQRGTGSTDYFSVYSGASVSVSQIANTPGVVSGKLNAVLVSANGSLYSTAAASGSAGTTGSYTWKQGTVGVDIPATGSVYYVTYTAAVPSTQFDPTIYSDKSSILAKYGPEGTTTGMLSIASSIVLENGADAVLICQASGSTASYVEADYKTAIDKLQKKKNIEYLVCVFPSGSVTKTQQDSLIVYAYSHVKNMSQNKRERGLVFGSPSSYVASDGIDTVGDTSNSISYVYKATSLKDKNVIYAVPSRLQRTDANGNIMELDANYAAAALAGLHLAQPNLATPINGFQVVGFTIQNEKWTENEMNQLGAGGCTVLESRDNVITVRDFLTTDGTSANTTEPTVVSQERLVKRTLREGLANIYTNKGKIITPTTTIDVEASTYSILDSLVNIGSLYGFGLTDNPKTGETKIAARQDSYDPRLIWVTCSVKYLYPLKFVSVIVSTYV